MFKAPSAVISHYNFSSHNCLHICNLTIAWCKCQCITKITISLKTSAHSNKVVQLQAVCTPFQLTKTIRITVSLWLNWQNLYDPSHYLCRNVIVCNLSYIRLHKCGGHYKYCDIPCIFPMLCSSLIQICYSLFHIVRKRFLLFVITKYIT